MNFNFKIGDRVRRTNREIGGSVLIEGATGTVENISGLIGVRWDKSFGGGHYWRVNPLNLELIKEKKINTKFYEVD